ncbi:DNA polymerase thumb domain-containing protein [Bacillus pseudomycoides]|uniref:Y-family DNA polymerase n=2 Tax=Bacillus pseudomycoides TaxID=64104 RepID=UPI0002E71BC1|nr:damage repair protein [Bacillus pseudomycoides]PGC39171.1 damage repair protein [Bacillus pseudomycoides]
MFDYSKCMNRMIFCIDLCSFFASCACVMRGLDPLKVKLAVVGDVNRKGSIVLACTPELKKLGISTATRLYEIPKDPNIIIVNATMGRFVEISNQITEIYTKYVALEDLHVFSIDECFLDMEQTAHLFGRDPIVIAERIQKEIYDTTGITASIGIGPNLFLSKVALDVESKHSRSRIVLWTYEDVPKKLWNIKPLKDVCGIGSATQDALHGMGLFSLQDVANTPKERLIKRFGKVKGEELHRFSFGIDESRIANKYIPKSTSITKGQILLEDCYSLNKLKLLILEQIEETCFRLRSMDKCCRTVELAIGYSKYIGGGFKRAITLDQPTCLTEDVYEASLQLLRRFHSGHPVRQIHITLKNLTRDDAIQMSLFEDTSRKDTQRKLAKTMDSIRNRYGKNSIMRGISYIQGATQRERNNKIGGHKA